MGRRQRCLREAASGVLGVSATQQRRHPAELYVFASCACVTFVLVAALAPLRGLWSSGGRRLIPCRTLDHMFPPPCFHIVVIPLHDGATLAASLRPIAQTQTAYRPAASSAPHVRGVVFCRLRHLPTARSAAKVLKLHLARKGAQFCQQLRRSRRHRLVWL